MAARSGTSSSRAPAATSVAVSSPRRWPKGAAVTALGRGSHGLPAGVRRVDWSLGEALPRACLDPALAADQQALVHLAHDWRERTPGDDRNRAGSLLLRDGARGSGLGRTVFASSQSARADAPNAYGRAKWAIEGLFDARTELSLRIGLVYGGPPMAMYGLLRRLARLPVIPMVAPHTPVQPIHRAEVARGILAGVDGPLSGTVGLAGPVPIAFGEVLTTLGIGAGRPPAPDRADPAAPRAPRLRRCSTRCRSVPASTGSASWASPARGRWRPEPISRVSACDVRPLADGILGEPVARRALIAEGRTLEGYVLRVKPGDALVRALRPGADSRRRGLAAGAALLVRRSAGAAALRRAPRPDAPARPAPRPRHAASSRPSPPARRALGRHGRVATARRPRRRRRARGRR